ncbi:tRNA nucleotidyltransferase [Metarhizium brunneum]
MGSEKWIHNPNVGTPDHTPRQPSQPAYKADLTSLFLATVFSPFPPGTTMDEVCLSKENVGRLRDLGFKNVAAVVLLPSVRLEAATVAPCDVSILAQTTIVRAVENFPKVSSNETRLDMLLQIFACLVLQPAIARCRSEGADIDVHDTESIPLDMGQPDSLNSPMNSSDLLLYDSLTQTLALQVLWNRGALDEQYTAIQAEAALASLVVLLHRLNNLRLPTSTLVAVTAYADPGDLWTTETAARLAQRILSLQLSGQGLTNFIIGPVLNQHVRLILSSPTGRDPSVNSRASGSVAALDLAEYENAAAVLNWAIRMTEVCGLCSFDLVAPCTAVV